MFRNRIIAMIINSNIMKLINDIKEDNVHGASELARRAVKVLAIAAKQSHAESTKIFLEEQQEIGQRLISVHLAMASIFNVVDQLLNFLWGRSEGLDVTAMKSMTLCKVNDIVEVSLTAVAKIKRHGVTLIDKEDIILTHSYSSTVIDTLREASKTIKVVIPQSGIGYIDNRITQQLTASGIPITFIDDGSLDYYLPSVSKIIVGADRVCADGAVVNAIGTYQIAKLAVKFGVPL